MNRAWGTVGGGTGTRVPGWCPWGCVCRVAEGTGSPCPPWEQAAWLLFYPFGAWLRVPVSSGCVWSMGGHWGLLVPPAPVPKRGWLLAAQPKRCWCPRVPLSVLRGPWRRLLAPSRGAAAGAAPGALPARWEPGHPQGFGAQPKPGGRCQPGCPAGERSCLRLLLKQEQRGRIPAWDHPGATSEGRVGLGVPAGWVPWRCSAQTCRSRQRCRGRSRHAPRRGAGPGSPRSGCFLCSGKRSSAAEAGASLLPGCLGDG